MRFLNVSLTGSIAAIVAFGLAAPASATEVEGTLTFPTGFVPAMTIYAREVDSAKLHTMSTHDAQRSFKLDLPPGRYVFFAEPSQAGAPGIYGAYTQNVICKAHKADDACDDHGLVVYSVGEKAPAPAISDWTIPDAQAEEFDQLLGNRQDTSPQELGAPHFSEYPVKNATADPNAAPAPTPTPAPVPALDFTGTALDPEQQQRLQGLIGAGANFAGDVVIAELPCGPNCVQAVFVALRTGKVLTPPALAQIVRDLPCRADEGFLFRRNSRLLSVTRRRDGGISTQYFVWKADSVSLVQTAEYQRTEERFCGKPSHEG